jgi:hypothetical protein
MLPPLQYNTLHEVKDGRVGLFSLLAVALQAVAEYVQYVLHAVIFWGLRLDSTLVVLLYDVEYSSAM